MSERGRGDGERERKREREREREVRREIEEVKKGKSWHSYG